MAASSVLAFGASGVTNGTVLIVSSILEPNNRTATALETENAPLTGKGVLLELTYLRTPTHLLFDYLVLFLLVEHNGTLCETERAVNKRGSPSQAQHRGIGLLWSGSGSHLTGGDPFQRHEIQTHMW
jgi:hypothetical protein